MLGSSEGALDGEEREALVESLEVMAEGYVDGFEDESGSDDD